MRSSLASQSGFVGRAQELARLEALWADGERLINLMGPGGIGKTRLALEAARRLDAEAVVMCALGEARDLDELLGRVAAALRLEDGPDAGARNPSAPQALLVERIGEALSAGAPLLVLDELERLVEVAGGPIRRWLALAPELRCLVTSRRALAIDEEVQLEVAPLASTEGVELFTAQARRSRPGWTPAPDEVAEVGELVSRLDGLPLAIKLCAARAAVLSPRDMLARLSARFAMLDAGPDDPITRHRSLQAVLDDSWELLTPAARTALARCASFRASFTVEAMGAILAQPRDALELAQTLRDHSLLRRVEISCGGAARFQLSESVRSYAAEKLAALGEREQTTDRLARYFHARARRFAGAERAVDLAELAAERDDVLAAFTYLLPREPAAADALLAIAEELFGHGWSERHLPLLEAAVTAAEAMGGAELRARALVAHAEALRLSGRLLDAERRAEVAQALADQTGVAALGAEALRIRGEVARGRGDARAEDLLEEARARAAAAGERHLEGRTAMALASVHYVQRRFERVLREARAAYAVWAALGRPADQALALQAQGVVLLELDRLSEARPALEEAADAYRAAGQHRGEGRVAIALAELAWAEGRKDDALELAHRAVALHQAQSAHPWLEMALAVLALLEVDRGRPEQALAHARQAIACMGSGEYVRLRVFVQVCGGVAEAACGLVAGAAASFAAARAAASTLEPLVGHFCEVGEGLLDVAWARRARAGGDEAEAARRLDRARARLEPAAMPTGVSFATSYDLRTIARMLAGAIAEAETEPRTVLRASAIEPPAALRVGPGAAWFSPPGGGRVEIDRGAWRLVLAALVRARLAATDEGLSTDELFAAGWPGERAVQHAARNRVWVALSGLRKLGLDALIVRRRGRYQLDPVVALEREE